MPKFREKGNYRDTFFPQGKHSLAVGQIMDFDVQAEQGGRHESEADSSAYVRNTGLNLINVADRVLVAIA